MSLAEVPTPVGFACWFTSANAPSCRFGDQKSLKRQVHSLHVVQVNSTYLDTVMK
jgi:hypothetical protein